MKIKEKFKELNATIFEHNLTPKYYLFIEGLNKNGEATDKVEQVEQVLVEVHEKVNEWSDFIDTIGYNEIDLETELNDLTFEKVKELCSYVLD